MTYDEVYSCFYPLVEDSTFFSLPDDYAYDLMRGWLHAAVGKPYIRKIFSSITLDDEVMTLTYSLTNSVDEVSDDDFVKQIFAQFMVIQWMRPKIDSILNIANIIGGKEEKKLQSNYKSNMERVEYLEKSLRKLIRDYGYENNDYLSGGTE